MPRQIAHRANDVCLMPYVMTDWAGGQLKGMWGTPLGRQAQAAALWRHPRRQRRPPQPRRRARSARSGRSSCAGRCRGRSNCLKRRPSKGTPAAGSAPCGTAACWHVPCAHPVQVSATLVSHHCHVRTAAASGSTWWRLRQACSLECSGREVRCVLHGTRDCSAAVQRASRLQTCTARQTHTKTVVLNEVPGILKCCGEFSCREKSGGGPSAIVLGQVRAVLANLRAALRLEALDHRALLRRRLCYELQQLLTPATCNSSSNAMHRRTPQICLCRRATAQAIMQYEILLSHQMTAYCVSSFSYVRSVMGSKTSDTGDCTHFSVFKRSCSVGLLRSESSSLAGADCCWGGARCCCGCPGPKGPPSMGGPPPGNGPCGPPGGPPGTAPKPGSPPGSPGSPGSAGRRGNPPGPGGRPPIGGPPPNMGGPRGGPGPPSPPGMPGGRIGPGPMPNGGTPGPPKGGPPLRGGGPGGIRGPAAATCARLLGPGLGCAAGSKPAKLPQHIQAPSLTTREAHLAVLQV